LKHHASGVLLSSGDQGAHDIYDATESRAARQRLPSNLWGIARRKLDMINAASQFRDLRIPPSNRLEALKGDLAGKYGIRINDQYRIVFAFNEGNARDVTITDYH